MNSRFLRIVAAALFALFGSAQLFAATDVCGRVCLKNNLDQYLNAVIKHDPSAVPLWIGFRQTENAAVVKPGNGLWKTMTGLGKVQRRYMDPVAGQAGYFGTILEGDTTDIVTLRLKVENHKVTEAEWLLVRYPSTTTPAQPGRGPAGPDGLAQLLPPDTPVSKENRSTRAEMIAAANSYFDALQARDGSLTISVPGCVRLENGAAVTGTGQGRGGQMVDRGDCTAHFENFNMIAMTARRFPIVDEDAGYVLGMTVFIRPPASPMRRNTPGVWFQMEKNRIKGIYATVVFLPPEQPAPNWPPYDGNWPLPPAFPVAPVAGAAGAGANGRGAAGASTPGATGAAGQTGIPQ